MKKIVIAACSALGLVVAMLAWVVAASGPASAGCDPAGTTYYSFTKLGRYYRATTMHSDWANGGQTVTIAKGSSTSKTYRTITTSTHTIDVGAEWGPIKASYNYQHTHTDDVATTKKYSLTESYSVKIPKAKTAREMRWARVQRFLVKKERTQNPCKVVVIGRATIEAPLNEGSFVWDFQDDDTKKPGCQVQGYPSYGGC